MPTLVCFHAHPDDESISTGGTMARAADDGHRVVLVVATDGAHGEAPDDLRPGETTADRRREELDLSGQALGVHRIVQLGYSDSGMTGWEQNSADGSFWSADVEEAAGRLAAVLREERPDVLTIYDWHGGYGHPDHIQVHRVGCRAAEMVDADLPGLRVMEATSNRDEIRRWFESTRNGDAIEFEAGEEFDPDAPMDDGNPFGTPESELTLCVDVTAWTERKRESIAAHRSQVTDTGFFLQMPPEVFSTAFGREWYVEHGREPGVREGWIFDQD